MALFTALAAASTASSLLGQIRQKDADKAVAKFNRRELFQRAQLVQQLAQQDASILRQAQAADRGQTIANFAARGVRVDPGTPMDTLMAQIKVDEFNASRTIFQADLAARDLRQQADVQEFQTDQRKQQSNLSMFGTLLGGTGSILGTLRT